MAEEAVAPAKEEAPKPKIGENRRKSLKSHKRRGSWYVFYGVVFFFDLEKKNT